MYKNSKGHDLLFQYRENEFSFVEGACKGGKGTTGRLYKIKVQT